ncbi:MAG: hypothetical protein XD52_0930 [bacterium 42_11]|nr:MAG: hypothetical protein XD52_0930 [bacterium 42_11]
MGAGACGGGYRKPSSPKEEKMCVMIYKEAGGKIPNKDILERCWNANPHGAGIAVVTRGGVFFTKGLMTFEAFLKKLKELEESFDLTEHKTLIHFRYGTSGGIRPEMTHPFPVEGNDIDSMEGWAKVILAHNGVIRGLGTPEESDTYRVAKFIRRLRKRKLSYDDIAKILELNNGRFILLSNRWTKLTGNWIKRYGYYFSNNKF